MRNVLWSAFRLLKAPTVLLIALAPAGCTAILGDFDGGSGDGEGGSSDASMETDGTVSDKDSGKTGDSGKTMGASCAMDSQCGSGSCTDGVCCETPCHGVCETCNLAGATPGKCMPVPANTDPAMECVLAPVSDAGTDAGTASDAQVANASGDAEAGASDAMADAGAADSATQGMADGATEGGPNIGYNPPDGGVVVQQTACAGSCNGMRACAFPDRTKNCGTQFCNTSSQQASFVCDGTGNCGLDLEACSRYACENGVCGTDSTTNCAGPADCLDDSYCNATTNKCVPKKQNSVGCSLSTECQTGYCSQGVCCNSSCDPTVVPGGTCTSPGKVGQCTCPACSTGACQIFYRDSDGDGQGDPNNTKVACAGTLPTGYVTNNSDCDDANANAFTGQTAYFSTPRANGSYDYDCDGKNVGTTAVLAGASCGFCSYSTTCGVNSYSCTAASAQSYLSCYVGFCKLPPIQGPPVETLSSFTKGPIMTDLACGGCYGSVTQGFVGTAACGAQAAYLYCGTCSSSSGSPYSDSYTQPFPCH
jgi:hypothetical protein